MKKCENCIITDVCKLKDEAVSVGTKVKDLLHNCKSYINRNNVIIPPCEIGANAYIIHGGTVVDRQVIGYDCKIRKTTKGNIQKLDFIVLKLIGTYDVVHQMYATSAIGKTIFFDKKDAEFALRKRAVRRRKK